MSIFLPKIKSSSLFTPTILLLSLLSVYFISTLDFAEKSYSYSYIFASTIFILILKAFIISFGNLETELKNKKWILIGVNLILLAVQMFFGILAIQHLTEEKYPQTTIQWIAISNIAFFVQSFLGKSKTGIRLSVIALVLYAISFVALYLKWFALDIERFILMQQSISYISLIIELCLLFSMLDFYVNLNPNSEKTKG